MVLVQRDSSTHPYLLLVKIMIQFSAIDLLPIVPKGLYAVIIDISKMSRLNNGTGPIVFKVKIIQRGKKVIMAIVINQCFNNRI